MMKGESLNVISRGVEKSAAALILILVFAFMYF